MRGLWETRVIDIPVIARARILPDRRLAFKEVGEFSRHSV